jgi:hypothetical protein
MREKNLKKLTKVSSAFILLSAISLGIEANYASRDSLQTIFLVLDCLLVIYFTLEIILRIRYKQSRWKEFISAAKNQLLNFWGNEPQEEIDTKCLEEWSWLLFDLLLVLLTYLSFLRHSFDHPQLVLLLRLFRIFRIFRLFELNHTLRKIEKKIISAIPTIITFLLLINIILYIYAVIGMYMYEFKKFNSIDFTSVYNAMTSLFILMANGWSEPLRELRTVATVPSLVTDAYIISFFIFSVLITLNVFLAVMTSQIQERFKNEMDAIKKKEEAIEKEITALEEETSKDNKIVNQKLDKILEHISSTKK